MITFFFIRNLGYIAPNLTKLLGLSTRTKKRKKQIKKLTLNTYFPREFGVRFKEKQENIVSSYKIYL